MYKPPIPIIDKSSKTISGFLPPVVSTHAEKGILSKEPDKLGAAISNANNTGLRFTKASLNTAEVGP